MHFSRRTLSLYRVLYKVFKRSRYLFGGRRQLAILLFCTLACAFAANATSYADYQLTTWKARDGAPSDIWAIAQDQDGFLWLGTGDGLYRFDGVHFWRFQSPFKETLLHDDITSLLAVPGNVLWMGYFQGGITRIEDGHVKNFGDSDGFPAGIVFSIVQDLDGTVWAATANGLARFTDKRWETVGNDWDYPTNKAAAMVLDPDGTLWVATGHSLVYLPRGAHQFQNTNVVPQGHFSPSSLVRDSRGALWASDGVVGTRALMASAGKDRPARLVNAAAAELHAYTEQTVAIYQGQSPIIADRLHFDAEGHLWGTDKLHGGVFLITDPARFKDGHAIKSSDIDVRFDTKNGLTSNKAVPIFEDREGNIWVGTNGGLNGFHRGDVTPLEGTATFDISKPFGMAPDDRGNVWLAENGKLYKVINGVPTYLENFPLRESVFFVDRSGALWTQSWDGKFYRKKGDQVTTVLAPDTLSDYKISAQSTGESDGLWLGFNDGSIYRREESGAWIPLNTVSTASLTVASVMSVDDSGRLWIGYSDGRLRLHEKGKDLVFTSSNGLHIGAITSMATSSYLDLVGGELGLAKLTKNGFQSLNSLAGRPITGVTGIVLRAGDYWINTNQGVIRINATELEKAFDNGLFQPQYKLFDYRDGLPGVAFQAKVGPTIGLDYTGKIWLQTNQGIAYIDPDRLHINKIAPSTSILSVTVNGQSYDAKNGLTLPKRTTNLSISYTAPSLYIPERVRFKYKLLGVDSDWQEAGQRREAFYTNLRPGSYTFTVIAANDDGAWTKEGASLRFLITPTFYQTAWFIVFCVAMAFLAVLAVFVIRLRQLAEGARMRAEVRNLERERIARELHDTLLQTVQGLVMRFHAVALRMPEGDPNRRTLESALDAAGNAIDEGRDRVKQIRGPVGKPIDLEVAFTKLVDELPCEHPVSFRVTTEGQVREFDPFVGDEIYRIGREAIVNAYRHSQPKLIELQLNYALSSFGLLLRDDGIGFDSEAKNDSRRPGHWGLISMKERTCRIRGRLRISSAPGAGTEIRLNVPASIAYLGNGSEWQAVIRRITGRGIVLHD
jgi:signal transduction histidine kinase/ligand-binding sensor domain-containing protein